MAAMPSLTILMKHLYELRLPICDYIQVSVTLLKLNLNTKYPVENTQEDR